MTDPKPTEFEYTSNHPQANMMVMQAIAEIQFWEKMKILMPMVAKELMRLGVKFPELKASVSGTEVGK